MAAVTINNFSRISGNQALFNQKPVFQSHGTAFNEFSGLAYAYLKLDYPKFHKMDNLSKLAFLTSEILLEGKALAAYQPDKIGMAISNNSSSTDTDIRYFNQIKKEIPSPGLFVYTLPNILVGEICIRHKIKGEQSFLVSDKYDIPLQVSILEDLFEDRLVDACIAGWVELIGEKYESFLFLAERAEEGYGNDLTIDNLTKLYYN